MKSITIDNIKEIAERLDCGFRAFIHKTTRILLFVPNENNFTDIDLEPWERELEQLENHFTDYYEIDMWSSNESFEIMIKFADQVSDKKLQRILLEALKKNKPFRQFKFAINDSGDFRQQWFDFKNKWQQDFVERQINRLIPTDE